MNEKEWFEATDPQWLFELAGEKISTRKVRLFAVACCRTIPWLLSPIQNDALDVAERHADGNATDQEMREALLLVMQPASDAAGGNGSSGESGLVQDHVARGIHAALYSPTYSDLYFNVDGNLPPLIPYLPSAFDKPYSYAVSASICIASAIAAYAGVEGSSASQEGLLQRVFLEHARLLRGIIGNPVRRDSEMILSAARLHPNIVLYAAQIYLSNSFHRAPDLAKMLQSAGIDNSDIVDETKSDDPHVKGTWLVDLVLGIE